MILLLDPLFFEQSDAVSFDLDIFLKDKVKLIHIATAGMDLVNTLNSKRSSIETNLRTVLSYRRTFLFEVNPNINRDNLSTLEEYTSFFRIIAKRGFYSYDKVEISDPNDYNFQLIARPTYDKRIIINNSTVFGDLESRVSYNYQLDLIQAKKNFPTTFDVFDIREYV